jgi:hypothetical protein
MSLDRVQLLLLFILATDQHLIMLSVMSSSKNHIRQLPFSDLNLRKILI